MKNSNKLIILAIGILLFSSCDKGFDDINKNPNATDQVSTPFILTYAEETLGSYIYDVWNSCRQSNLASQQMCQNNYTEEDRYAFRRSVSDGFYRGLYSRLQGFQDIINLNTVETTKGLMNQFGDNEMQIGSSMLMKIWGVQLLAETFGDVPYKEALIATTVLKPKYDTQKELFSTLLADAKTAVGKIKASHKGWTSGDVIYGGDISKWVKFGNSMRLRLLLRTSNVDPGWKAKAKAIIAEGVMTSNEDNALIQYKGGGAPNDAPLFVGFKSRNDFTYTRQFVNLIQGLDDPNIGFVNPFKDLKDPRYDIYLGQGNLDKGTTIGIPYGMSNEETQSFAKANKVVNLKSNPRPSITTNTFPSSLLDYPTVCFMIAEVEDMSAQWLEKGIRASIEMWGGNMDEAYIKAVKDRFAAASPAKKQEMIITQKYIHLLTQGFEAWSEYRRTGYPKSLVLPGQVTYVNESGGKVIFKTLEDTGGIIVPRLRYDTNEYTLNSENVKKAAESIGGDSYTTKLWWAKK